MPRVLVVAGKSDAPETVRPLTEAGFEVAVPESGAAALLRFQRGKFDLVILDLTLSEVSGFDLIHEIRVGGDDVPLIVLGAGDSEAQRVLSLDLGADDYLSKPFSTRELVSRARAILRRARPELVAGGSVRSIGWLMVDLARHEVSLGGRSVDVTAFEFKVLVLLSSSPGQVFTRRQIMEHLWSGPYFGDGHPVDTHMLNLRRKIEPDPTRPSRLLTVRGVGFRLVAPANERARSSLTESLESTHTRSVDG